MLLLPWHLTDHLAGGLDVTSASDTVVIAGRPGTTGSPWTDLVGVYAALRDAVARHREIAALDSAVSWLPADADREQADAAVHAVLTAAGTSG